MRQASVYRPLGLTIAIFAGVVLFGLWPVTKLYVAWRLNAGFEDDGVIMGGSIPFDTLMIVTGIMGGVVIVTALFAWLGRPRQIRFIFQFAVLATGLCLISETLYRISQETKTLTATSGDQVLQNILLCQLPLQILMTVYIIWYCNRAPARAFYRQEPYIPPQT